MPVALTHMRAHLMPGLMAMQLRYSFLQTKEIVAANVPYETTPAAPHVWVPKLTIPQAIIVGAAATIIANPTVTRRFWAGWKL